MALVGVVIAIFVCIFLLAYKFTEKFIRTIWKINKIPGPRSYFPLGNIHQFKPNPNDYLDIFNQQAKVLVKIFDKKSTGGPFDIFRFITHCALDIICESAMGRHVDAQNCDQSEYVQAVYKMDDILHDRSKKPYLWPSLLFKMFGRKKEHDRALEILHGFTKMVIRERSEEISRNGGIERLIGTLSSPGSSCGSKMENGRHQRLAFLDFLLTLAHSGKLTIQDVREEVDTFMFEGHDTTSAAMNWTLHLLACSPKDQVKVHEELDGVFGDENRDVSVEDLKNLCYLECCLKEALRLYPSVPMFSRILSEDLEIGGYSVPKGQEVAINPYAVHRDPRHWTDPEMFLPERFLPENSVGRHPFAYIPFSGGGRNCIGQRFALMEEKTVLAWILRYFKVDSMHRRDQIRPKGELILRPTQGVWLSFVPRKPLLI